MVAVPVLERRARHTWATAVGVTAYYGGRAAADAIRRYGLYVGTVVVVVVIVGWLGGQYARGRVEKRL